VDRELKALGTSHIRETTGALEALRMNPQTPYDGSGVTLAILDSGIDNEGLADFRYKGSSESRIKAVVDFTGEDLGADELQQFSDYFGHGSHVAGIAAGNGGSGASPEYAGIAPNADLVILRVLDSSGKGSASALLGAIDWCIQNREQYNIRVMNLSLGAPVTESFSTDPLCLAVDKAIDEGIVVVCSAGNFGKDKDGKITYGSILSPGIAPHVISVGSVNTKGTLSRKDDEVSHFSSRGPTRGFHLDPETRETVYDNLLKPDLLAPGSWIPSVCSHRDGQMNYIMAQFGDNGLRIEGTDDYMQLNGTSMAAPVVSGAIALMLQANPGLSPSMVKGALMYTAQRMSGVHVLDQGAGVLNVPGAVRLALAIHPDASSFPEGTNVLVDGMPDSGDTIGRETILWNAGAAASEGDSVPDVGMLYAQGVLWSDEQVARYTKIRFRDGYACCDGPIWLDETKTGTVEGSGVLWADLRDGTIHGSGVLWSDPHEPAPTGRKRVSLFANSFIPYTNAPEDSMSFVDEDATVLDEWEVYDYQTEANFVLVGDE
jgi:subtilisin family serine protease